MPVQSLLPLKEAVKTKVTFRTRFRSFLAVGTNLNADGSAAFEGTSSDGNTVLYLICDGLSVVLDGKNTTVQATSFEVDWNVAHFADLIGALKPLLIDLDPVPEDDKDISEMSYY